MVLFFPYECIAFLMRCRQLVLHWTVVSFLNWRRKYWPNGVMKVANVKRSRPILMITFQRSRMWSEGTPNRHHYLIRRRYGLTTSITWRHKIGWKLGNVFKGTEMNENNFAKNAKSARKKLLIGYSVGWAVLLLIIIFSIWCRLSSAPYRQILDNQTGKGSLGQRSLHLSYERVGRKDTLSPRSPQRS